MRTKMKKKRTILIVILIFLIIITIIFTVLKVASLNIKNKASVENILKSQNYEIIAQGKKGDKLDEYNIITHDYIIYQQNETSLVINVYDNYNEAKQQVIDNYNEKKKASYKIELTENKNYTQTKFCHEYYCFYELAYKNYFITSQVEVSNNEIDKLFKQFIQPNN